MEGGHSARPQIVFFTTAVRDAAEQQNLATFLKFNGKKDFKRKNDKFLS